MVKAVKQGYPRSKEEDPKLGAKNKKRTEIIEIEYNSCKTNIRGNVNILIC